MIPIPGRGPREAIDEEIRHHVREHAELLEARGWGTDEAWREAERRFGDQDRIRRELLEIERRQTRRVKTMELLRSMAADAAYALRGLRTNRTFAAAVVATLALGIGAATSIYAVIDAVLVRPLPYEDADRWVEVNRSREDGGYAQGVPASRTPEWREAADDVFEGWVMYLRDGLVRTDGTQAHELNVVAVSPGADTLLGIPLLLGRGPTAEDARPGAPPVAVLSRSYWERMGADPAVLGSTMRLESGPVTVVGVLRGGVKFPQDGRDPDIWLPMRSDLTYADREVRSVQGLWARLPEGMALEVAQERADAAAEALARSGAEQEGDARPFGVRLVPLDAHRANPDVRQGLWTLAATVGAIFLIALVNGTNLLLVRASARSREFGVRTAMGASRSRLVRQLLIEGLFLGLLGGGAAVAVAWVSVTVMAGIVPSEVHYFSPHALGVEGRTLRFAFLASLLAGVLLGLLPAVEALRRRDSLGSLAGRGGSDGPARRRLRDGLVVAQVALSMVLLVAAGLFANGFARLLAVDPGFDVERVALADMMLSPTRYGDPAARADFGLRLEQALETRPELEGVALHAGGGFSFGVALEAEGRPVHEDQPEIVPHSAVAEDYFRTVGLEVVAGRGLGAGDAGTDNVVVDEDLARFLWGAEGAVGRRFRLDEDGEWMKVVGVVEELMLMGRDERSGPYQFLAAKSPDRAGSYLGVAMRTSGSPSALLGVFQQVLREVDPEQSYWRLRTAADALAEEEEKPRFLVTLMSLLAAIAVTLASVGLYGVLAYSVTRRSRELGIRMALGAARRRVRRMVMLEGVAVAGLGVVIGVVGGLATTRLIQGLLYGVEPHDPATFAVTATLFLALATVASLLPAGRATRVDPVEVLKAE